jgi:hypothetical protein
MVACLFIGVWRCSLLRLCGLIAIARNGAIYPIARRWQRNTLPTAITISVFISVSSESIMLDSFSTKRSMKSTTTIRRTSGNALQTSLLYAEQIKMTFSLRSTVIAFGFALSSWVFLLLYFLLQRRNCKRNLNCRVDDAIIAFFHPYWYGATLNATNLTRRI